MPSEKMVLIALIVAAGLYDFKGAQSFVKGLERDQLDSMISALSNNELQPAYRVASITQPRPEPGLKPAFDPALPEGLDLDAIYLEPTEGGELLIKGLNPNTMSPEQFRLIEDRLRKLIIRMKTQVS